MSLYKKIASAKNEIDFTELNAEMKDRFGSMPEPVEMLLKIAFLKRECQKMGIDKITSTRENIKVFFNPELIQFDPSKVVTLIQQDQRLRLEPPAQLTIQTKGLVERDLLCVLQGLLDKIKGT